MRPEDILLFLPVLLFSVVVHEYAHGWVARTQGDDTAYKLGRLTLNPVPHIDPFGSIILPLILVLIRSPFIFGMAKPVPVNPRLFRNFKRGDILVSIAGVAANLALAVIATIVLIVLAFVAKQTQFPPETLMILDRMGRMAVRINLVLAFFNLIPIPPLDGSHLLYHMLPPRAGMAYREMERYGFLLLIILLMVGQPILRFFMLPAFLLYEVAMKVVALWT